MAENYTIKIPEKVYVGFQRTGGEDAVVPLGFLTPYSTDAAGVKRQQTVDRWAKGYGSSRPNSLNTVVLENKPMTGFRISRSLRRLGWTSSNVLVRIEDPRGFELEISVANFIMLTDNNIIHNGEIIQECVWGRDGTENRLLPVNSAPYLQAKENTERMASSTSVRNVKPGNEIELQKGGKCTYVGSWYALYEEDSRSRGSGTVTRGVAKKRHFVKTVDSAGTAHYKGYTSLKIARVIDATETSIEDLRAKLQDECINGKVQIEGGCSSYYQREVALIRSETYTIDRTEFQTVTHEEAKEQATKGYNAIRKRIFAKLNDGRIGHIASDNFYNRGYIYGHGYLKPGFVSFEQVDPVLLKDAGNMKAQNTEIMAETDIAEYFVVKIICKETKDDAEFVVYA